MSSVSLVVTGKWRSRPPMLIVPGHGVVIRPGTGGLVHTSYQYVATWLINNGYCRLLEPEKTPKSSPKPAESAEPKPVEAPAVVDRQLYLDENSNLQFIPPLEPAPREPALPIENVRLINFFMTAEVAEINGAISVITLKKAQELKQVEILQWSDVTRILSDRAIEAAIKWAQTVA